MSSGGSVLASPDTAPQTPRSIGTVASTPGVSRCSRQARTRITLKALSTCTRSIAGIDAPGQLTTMVDSRMTAALSPFTSLKEADFANVSNPPGDGAVSAAEQRPDGGAVDVTFQSPRRWGGVWPMDSGTAALHTDAFQSPRRWGGVRPAISLSVKLYNLMQFQSPRRWGGVRPVKGLNEYELFDAMFQSPRRWGGVRPRRTRTQSRSGRSRFNPHGGGAVSGPKRRDESPT